MSGQIFDLAVIGGGINGCAIARDAAGRGLSVFLCEERDLGGATSSASTKLIHGGLRYLEYYDFGLVRESLVEREVLLRAAPHLIRPVRLVLPHHGGLRPWLVIRAGLFLYDHLSFSRTLPATRSIDLSTDPAGLGLKKAYHSGFEFSDCTVDDSRLVVMCARDAADRGAEIRTRTRCLAARRDGDVWRLTLNDGRDAAHYETVNARALVNAAGPWVDDVISGVAGLNAPAKVRLVKGSHIVVDKLFDHDRAYLFQNADGRICFAIPYERDFTLIGTTDEDFTGDPASAAIDEAETEYLLGAVGEYLDKPINRETIRWTYAGVRPLLDTGSGKAQAATREYMLALDAPADAPPLLSVFGGKLTTHRSLAEHALKKLGSTFPGMGAPWTAKATLPGGDIADGDFDAWALAFSTRFPSLPSAMVNRLCRAHGTRAAELLDGITTPADMGRDFGAGLTEREIDYLVANEWAVTADDILWRRTKLGLRLASSAAEAVSAYLQSPRG